MDAIPDDAQLTPRERLYVEAARALFEDDYPRAIAEYQRLLAEYPYDVEGRQFLAEAYFLNFQNTEAIEELRKLGAQEPENEFVWSGLGTYLILAGRAEEARTPLQRYLALAPEDPHPYTLLGDLERQLGDYSLAEKHFRDALERNPSFSLARLGLAETIALAGKIARSERDLVGPRRQEGRRARGADHGGIRPRERLASRVPVRRVPPAPGAARRPKFARNGSGSRFRSSRER